VVDIEHGTASYNADVINRIEKVLGVKIPRGRGNKKKRKAGGHA
jgi:ribosome-binding protein aMBF1 (putative translation factor)